jgi:polyhydroxybutyrate depolymerase
LKMIKLLLTLFLLLPLSIFSQTRIDVKFNFDGADREFILVRPSGAVPAGGYPIVFMFHGAGGDGETFYNSSKWKERGEIEKFITVFPTAVKYCVLNFPNNNQVIATRWNNGNLVEDKCPNVVQTFKDDVKFIRKMVDTIKTSFSVNPKKVFASGFSNGATMVFKLAMDAPDVFAAVAGSSSILHALDSVKPSRKIPIWNIVGTIDDRFTSAVGVSPLPYGGDSALLYMKIAVTRVLDCEGLSQTYTKSVTARTNTFIYGTPKTGQAPSLFNFTLVKDMAHEYPNGVNYPIVAADAFWEFFKQSVATDVDEIHIAESVVTIYPNPSNSEMIVDLSKFMEGRNYNVSVFNTLGQNVFQLKNQDNPQLVLAKKTVGEGFFIVKINQGQRIVTKRIVFQ